MEEKFLEYARKKEDRLCELLRVIDVGLILKFLTPSMCRSGKAGYELIKEMGDKNLLLSEFQHFRIIDAIRKADCKFYTPELTDLRNFLYRENYSLICKAVWNASGTINEDLVSVASVAFLEALDNLMDGFDSKPQTYVYKHMFCRLKEYIANQKTGVTIVTYLKRFCSFENADDLIAQGKVKINGKPCYNRKQVVSFEDEVVVGDDVRSIAPKRMIPVSEDLQVERVARKEFWDLVRGIIGSEHLEIIYLKLLGYSLAEIADEFGMEVSRVRSIVASSMSKLKRFKNEFSGFSF